MESISYIADNDNSNKTYFDIDPSPIPFPTYEISRSKRKTLNTRNESDEIISGQWHHYNGGGHMSGAVIDIEIQKLSREKYNAIISKILKTETFIFSPDDGETKYECMMSQDSAGPEAIDGTQLLRWSLKLDILAVS